MRTKMKYISIVILLLLSFVAFFIPISSQNDLKTPCIDTANVLLKTYRWNTVPNAEEDYQKVRVEQARGIWNSVNSSDNLYPYNLSGITWDLADVYVHNAYIHESFENSIAEVYRIPLINDFSNKIKISAEFLFLDGIMYVARIQIAGIGIEIDNDLLQKIHEEGLSCSWSLDTSKDQFAEDIKAWEAFVNKNTN